MSINLTKNKAQILDAWTKVSNNEDGYDWALFSYEGRTFELKVVSFTILKFHVRRSSRMLNDFDFRKRLVLVELKVSAKSSTMVKYNMPL